MYTLLGKVSEAKKSFRREGNYKPLHEDVAERVGISNEKLAKLLFAARTPLSMQQTVWADQNVTFQVIIHFFEVDFVILLENCFDSHLIQPEIAPITNYKKKSINLVYMLSDYTKLPSKISTLNNFLEYQY